VFEADGFLPAVRFYVTGDSKHIASSLLAREPNSCPQAGYLTHEQHLRSSRGADVIILSIIRNHTLLSGAHEAVYVGTPLITSDWPVLKD
jgi:hypothetical protein